MNQQPDQLFREKLEGYQKPAPASAWEKIAAAQSKKNDKWLWLKIAASIALVAVVGYISWPETKTQDLSQESLAKPKEQKTSEQVPSTDTKAADVKTETSEPSSKEQSTSSSKRNRSVKKISPITDGVQDLNLSEIPKEEVLPLQNETNENIASLETVIQPQIEETSTAAQPDPQKITLVYTAKDVEEYLDKKSLAEATSDSKKSSTLKKLLKKAEDLTNNQDPFGELRQKKNEILALNFKSEKQRGQNK